MDVREFSEALFRLARQRFEEFEVHAFTGESFFVRVAEQKCEKYTVRNTAGVSFRAKRNGRTSRASSSEFSEESAARLVENAEKSLAVLESKDESFIFEGSPAYAEADSYNPELEQFTPEQRIALAMELEQKTLAASPEIRRVESSAVGYSQNETLLRNSKGLSLYGRNNLLYAYVVPIAERGGEMNSGMAYAMGRSPQDIDPDKLAREAVRDAVAQLGAQSCESGVYPVVLRYDAAADLLATFSGIFSAEAAQRGLSLLKGREGEQIAAPCVTITDDPLCAFAPIRRAFDEEGVASQRKNVVENGMLKTLLYDLKTAAKAGAQSTGNSGGDHVSPGNFYIQAGLETVEALLRRAEGGLLITELNGLHSGANAVTGDFSLSAKGYRIQNGACGDAVSEITVSGNFYTLLRSVVAVGNDFRWGFPGGATFGAPSLLTEGLSVAGSR